MEIEFPLLGIENPADWPGSEFDESTGRADEGQDGWLGEAPPSPAPQPNRCASIAMVSPLRPRFAP
eukprot:5820021-Alexandrium_andersonii.AAC.1